MQNGLIEIDRHGLTMVPGVFTGAEIDALIADLEAALAQPSDATAIRSRADNVYAARNLLEVWPAAKTVWRSGSLPALLAAVLGPDYGLVRGLYFDKPPEQTWALPWHKDMTIAVQSTAAVSPHFVKPTRKAGVPHVEAPLALLQAMLTLRIHLDDVTEANGPMRVIPGSHRSGKNMDIDERRRQSVLATRGDVLAIRPLVAHNSAASAPDCDAHRRIVHLEFAGWPSLPDGYAWHTFLRGAS